MAPVADKQPQGVFRALDKWTVGIYVALLVFGWISVCGASYTYGSTDIFSMSSRSGMQIVWIATSLALGFVIMMTDDRMYSTFAYLIYQPATPTSTNHPPPLLRTNLTNTYSTSRPSGNKNAPHRKPARRILE